MNWTHLTSLNCGQAAQIRITTKGRACSLEIGRIPAEGTDPSMKLERHFRLESEQDVADIQEGIRIAQARIREHQVAYDAHKAEQKNLPDVKHNRKGDNKRRDSDKKPAIGIKQLARIDAAKKNPDAAADLARKEAERRKKPKNDRSSFDQEQRAKMRGKAGQK